ncbi:hypothetical protein CHS0354_035259 [Potamilus streckersoni]|uniref:Serine aminopeptidase S33 domain-containing protein n=1 Tax=Potamilus streckersoni TaxID=2493646 RepID=A0AAE0S2V6_9BIVA|nr:hypothetical protein CHS0354_035259 [Potamilus streckersoni]
MSNITFRPRLLKLIFIPALALIFLSCSGLLFQPHRRIYNTPDELGIKYEDIYTEAQDGIKINGWKLIPENYSTGISILHFHGNGENISTYFRSMVWLVRHGVTVYLFDYRGYGNSEGTASFPEVFMDLQAAYDYVAAREQKIVIMGQSLGGALSVYFVGSKPRRLKKTQAMILDAPIITRYLRYPLSLTMPGDHYDPINYIGRINIPILLFHSPDDQVIPYRHAEVLTEKQPRIRFIPTAGPHIHTFGFNNYRNDALRFLSEIYGVPLGFEGD